MMPLANCNNLKRNCSESMLLCFGEMHLLQERGQSMCQRTKTSFREW